MKKILSLAIAGFLFILPFSNSASCAELSRSDRVKADSAFLFVERKGWDDALLHAKRASNPLLSAIIQFLYYREKDSGARFEEIVHFIRSHKDWPDKEILHVRAEEALLNANYDDREVKTWLQMHPPQTGIGKLTLAETMERTEKVKDKRFDALVRQGWIEADLDPESELRLYNKFSQLLTEKDHKARIDRLLWQEKTGAAERMLAFINPRETSLVEARIALIENARNAPFFVNQVPRGMMNDPGLLYDRLRWRLGKGDEEGAEELLLSAPKTVPFPEKWWKLRERFIRKSIQVGNYRRANNLVETQSQLSGSELAEALWLSGWLKLEHLRKPDQAYKDFYALYHGAKYPVSKARGAYWAAQAAKKNGNQDISRNWLNEAIAFPTTFYGQLAAAQLYKGAVLNLPARPRLLEKDIKRYQRKELPRVVRLLGEAGQYDLAHKFTLHLVDLADSAQEAALAASLGRLIGRPEDSVKAAKRANQQHNYVLAEQGYPHLRLPSGIGLEKSLVMAITRQESEFDASARSPADALGLMQLLPSTAKQVAKKAGLGYSRNRLFESEYNLRMGSFYLNKLIDQFDGSYVMAIAAYNAGPGNVRKWEEEFGVPGTSVEQAVRWIENIPFAETRNYVQRVIENLQIYRHILAEKTTPKMGIAEDLTR